MSDWKITDLDLFMIALTNEQFTEWQEIDNFIEANPLYSWKEYKIWFDRIETFDKKHLIYNHIAPKVNAYCSKGFGNYLYIYRTWEGFQSKAQFVKTGITIVPKLLEYYWPDAKSLHVRFMESRLLFIPVTKKLSVIVALHD